MADVRKYTEQIASAKKGKDVRGAIVSAINEVSDENNTYNQTKADILAAQKSINADVTKNQQTQQAFNSNLQEAKEVQRDLTAKMNTGTTLAENLEKKNTTATSLDKSLGEKNTAATKTVLTDCRRRHTCMRRREYLLSSHIISPCRRSRRPLQSMILRQTERVFTMT